MLVAGALLLAGCGSDEAASTSGPATEEPLYTLAQARSVAATGREAENEFDLVEADSLPRQERPVTEALAQEENDHGFPPVEPAVCSELVSLPLTLRERDAAATDILFQYPRSMRLSDEGLTLGLASQTVRYFDNLDDSAAFLEAYQGAMEGCPEFRVAGNSGNSVVRRAVQEPPFQVDGFMVAQSISSPDTDESQSSIFVMRSGNVLFEVQASGENIEAWGAETAEALWERLTNNFTAVSGSGGALAARQSVTEACAVLSKAGALNAATAERAFFGEASLDVTALANDWDTAVRDVSEPRAAAAGKSIVDALRALEKLRRSANASGAVDYNAVVELSNQVGTAVEVLNGIESDCYTAAAPEEAGLQY